VRSLVEAFPDHLAARLPDVCAKHAAVGLTDGESWATLRDLAAVLPADANIVQFRRRFELVDDGEDGNADVLTSSSTRSVPISTGSRRERRSSARSSSTCAQAAGGARRAG
jgi:hypothetical protein